MWDGAVQTGIGYVSGSTNWSTTLYYNTQGQLTSAYVADGKPHWVYYTSDELGQVLRRDETTVSGQTGAPHEVWYRFAGRELGYAGNNGTSAEGLDASITERIIAAPSNQGTFRGKQVTGAAYSQFGAGYDPINSYDQGSASGSYTVRTGDTLRSIAQGLYGDANLWYKLAEANGIAGEAGLTEGQRLTLPAGISADAFNAATAKPYDPAAAIGDLSPSTAPKPKKGKCGVFGQILAVIVAVVATKFLGPITGNLVSQGFNNLIGIQHGFSWKQFAIAQISAAVTGGLDAVGAFASVASDTLRVGLTAATASAITQGISVATRLQDKFDFVGVAAAGIGAAAGQAAAGSVTKGFFSYGTGSDIVYSLASDLANAATRSALEGSNFGDNILAALPDTIGQVIGRAIGRGLEGAIGAHAVGQSTGKSDGNSNNSAQGKVATAGARVAADVISRNTGGAFNGGFDGPHPGGGDDAAPDDGQVNAYPDQEIVVTADRERLNSLRREKHGIFWRITNAVGSLFKNSANGGADPSRVRPSAVVVTVRKYGNIAASYGSYAIQSMIGPGTPTYRLVNVPVNATMGAIANSPVGDAGAITTLETSGVPWFEVGGEALKGVGGYAKLVGTVRVANVADEARLFAVADDPLSGAVAMTSKATESFVPQGFASLDEFVSFGGTLRGGLGNAGYADADAILQGSAVTGKSFTTGAAFDVGRVSDFDVALTGNSLFQAAKNAGVGLRSAGTRTAPLNERALRKLGLFDLASRLSAQAGRPVNFMIYQSTAAAVSRSPSIFFPR